MVLELAQKAYKGKMSRRSIQRMMDGTGSESRQRRNYVIQVIDATILAGGDYKPGDVATINLMSKKTDDFEQYENEVWKPVAERNILSGILDIGYLLRLKTEQITHLKVLLILYGTLKEILK